MNILCIKVMSYRVCIGQSLICETQSFVASLLIFVLCNVILLH